MNQSISSHFSRPSSLIPVIPNTTATDAHPDSFRETTKRPWRMPIWSFSVIPTGSKVIFRRDPFFWHWSDTTMPSRLCWMEKTSIPWMKPSNNCFRRRGLLILYLAQFTHHLYLYRMIVVLNPEHLHWKTSCGVVSKPNYRPSWISQDSSCWLCSYDLNRLCHPY